MKKVFSIYIEDDCELRCANICALVADKNDYNNNGLTILTLNENDCVGDNEWLFSIKGKAVKIKCNELDLMDAKSVKE